MIKKTIILAAVLAPLAASAQDINTEVVVDRTVTPVERAATRPAGLTPTLDLPAVLRKQLDMADFNSLASITRSYTRLDPAAGALTPAGSPYRGYVMAGYFPVYNLGISAGYRAIDSERMSLNVFGQFDGDRRKVLGPICDNYGTYNIGVIGADFGMLFGNRSRLTAGADFSAGAHSVPSRSSQSLVGGTLEAGWNSAVGGLNYNASVRTELDSYGSFEFDAIPFNIECPSVSQQRYTIGAGASLPLDTDMALGLDAEGDFIHSSRPASDSFTDYTSTLGAVALTPYFKNSSEYFHVRLGVKVDLGTGGHDSKVHVAPDVLLGWTPRMPLAVSARFGGGSVLNSIRSLRAISPYIEAVGGYGRSHVPFEAEGEVRVGPFAGFAASLVGAYAKADRWMMPDNLGDWMGYFDQCDISGWNAGVRLSYESARLHAAAHALMAPSKAEKAWYLWRDRAKYVIGAEAHYDINARLSVGAAYEFRGHREAYRYGSPFSLGACSDLSINGAYKITDRLGVHLNLENLLCRRYQIVPGIYSASLHGLAGISYKF